MSYVVLARKWRPQTFSDLVGQEHVSRTLANAIATDRVAHAFLFTGVRGVGKTSSARMLAKALNCEKGPSADPCLTCNACREIGDGVDVDVQEIDGASYTGVDAVRSLQETIPYRPARDRFKIYIVDEVHMLSTAAWNAFLKTLEEPPPHVKFIFATTEVNKVPVTILSRCQRYDFKLISTDQIAERLRQVLDSEGVAADDEAVRILAREAAGSMRDAMSLLDQVIAWGGASEALTAEAVARVLGVAARSVLHQLGAALVKGEAATCLDVVADLAEQGYQISNVARDFLSHLRDLVVAKVSDRPERLLDMGDEERRDLVSLASECEASDLSRIYLGFSRAYDDVARSAQPRGAFEMALVRLARRPPLVPIDDLIRRLGELEQRLARGGSGGGSGGGGRAPTGGAGSGPSGAAPREPVADMATAASTPMQATSTTTPSAGASHREPPSAPRPPATTPSPPSARPAARPGPRPPGPAFEPPPMPTRAPSAAAPPSNRPQPTSRPRPASGPLAPWTPPANLPTGHRPPPPSELPASEPSPGLAPLPPLEREAKRPQDPAERADWEAVVALVREQKPALASVFVHAAPLSVTAEGIELAYEEGTFLAQQASEAEAQSLLTDAAAKHFGRPVSVTLQLGQRHLDVQSIAAKNAAELRARIEAARERVIHHPLVVAAVQHLGAELRDVRLPAELTT
ncbi:MAG: DNA polymerase III subunit gamma/tau [Polyangiaceae bacterium]